MTKNKFVQCITNGFQTNKGKASFYCFSNKLAITAICNAISKYHKKHTDGKILIVVDSYNTRANVINELTAKNEYNDNIIILSADFIHLNYLYHYDFTIIVGVNDNDKLIVKLTNESTFTMCILTKNIMNNEFINNIRKVLPNIETSQFDGLANKLRVLLPVEEHLIPIALPSAVQNTYDKYSEYIAGTVSIFGNIDNIEKSRIGDTINDISAAEFRNKIAYSNGWREDLDTSIPYIKEIDEYYNPNNLYERANNFYNITRQRRDLVANYEGKLFAIKDICETYNNKKILIISKNGDFARSITKYLVNNGVACGDYHDCIEDCTMTDTNGLPILVKSGANKGKMKIFGHQAQSTLNLARFNDGLINVLSIKFASNTKLKTAYDVAIFTSGLYSDIKDFRERFSQLESITGNIAYVVYCTNTIEEDKAKVGNTYSFVKKVADDKDFICVENNDVIVL